MSAIAAAPAPAVTIATNLKSYPIAVDADFDAYCTNLVQLLCNRVQWTKMDVTLEKVAADCRAYAESRLPGAAEEIAAQDLVEVQIPESAPMTARQFPWEFVISEITRERRKHRRPLLVTRQLVRTAPIVGPFPPPAPAPVQVAMISSEPGQLAGKFSFASEENLLISSFAADVQQADHDPQSATRPLLPSATFAQWKDPTLAELKAQLLATHTDVVHFCGIDGWQGAAMLNMPPAAASDGVFLPDEGGAPVIASPEGIADAVCAGVPPSLVGFNLYFSSSQTASATVAKGAGAAIGFQDDIDDAVAERFFAIFYDVWYQGRDLIAAYQAAFAGLSSEHGHLRGSGIVLWSARSLLQPTQATKMARLKPRPFPLLQPGEVPDHRTAVTVELTECSRLNYSMLHNNRPLFEVFRLKRQGRGSVQGVHVRVSLHAGTEEANYEASFDLTESVPIVDANNFVRVSLTSELSRSLQESVVTSLYVSVTWGQHIILQTTCRVALLPTDEWQDDDLNRIWLPSFVLPRDPVVMKLLDSAQRYLVAIADHSDAGFDAYQSIAGLPEERYYPAVDAQVQAIWWALVQDFRLAYINPPPTFTESAQRLRTPSDCIDGKRGTCIDLALLLAAALEYIEMYPVVFLLEGHAFPGYCRSEAAHKSLVELLSKVPQDGPSVQNPAAIARMPEVRSVWMFDKRYYWDIVRMVRAGQIVPIETTLIASAAGFSDAVTQGIENFRNKAEFQYLVDIQTARERNVTPIPRWRVQ
jgi:hypothetical protein